ncbi:hypothetical protein [Rhodococcoides yunnanense]|uniref:hypothetical protein n=1 Tax=Rhodococcoides yunnanense TaxID=278209 RepID=UPI0022B1CC21|nr:hypothetical protein [Rhodococcus yunnanensis]MCZ4279030.1 hypothetical protein [Rhodococcus yunnanensis]
MDPLIVLRSAFGGLAGTERALVFGSWAARYLGVPGHQPQDIDVLCLGHRRIRPVVYAAANAAEARLRDECNLSIPVNPIVRSYQYWITDADPFLREVRSCPHIVLTSAHM